jgi:hypothetical protein
MNATAATPWYRHRWPWILMAGPMAVVAAGTVTAVVAFSGADALVADDYYKRGLAINRTLEREDRARALGLSGWVEVGGGRVVARIEATGALPERLRITFVHPTRGGEDRVVHLARTASGDYTGDLKDLPAGRWDLLLEAPDWRHAQGVDNRGTPGAPSHFAIRAMKG